MKYERKQSHSFLYFILAGIGITGLTMLFLFKREIALFGVESPASVVIKSPDSAITEVSGMTVPGDYYYELKVTDDKGAVDYDTVKVTVKNGSLPVKLTSFTAKALPVYNLIEWVSEYELNTSKYDLEASSDGVSFISIQTIKSKNSPSKTVYEAKHVSPLPITYYRLKMIDVNGTFSYSAIAVVKRNVPYKATVITPVGSDLIVVIESQKPIQTNVTIYDIAGRVYDKKIVYLSPGVNRFRYNIARFSSGVYVVSIDSPEGITAYRFVK